MNLSNLDERLSEIGFDRKKLLRGLMIPAFFLVVVLFVSIFMTVSIGSVIWGINIPVAWGFAIVNFVWWIGIGHAGTLISAILLLARQNWRNSINRLAESMTLFAVASAGLYPLLHMGRPWFFYWLLPYPNDMTLIPQYRSPLVWDAFAVSTYALVSLLFWYLGLIPDLAVAREKTQGKIKRAVYSVLSLGFTGEIREWHSYKKAVTFMAIIATPLVISVHTIVSLDFAVGTNPGWHSALFPPFFVAGAIYSGFAMVILLMIFVRHQLRLQDLITKDHLERCARMLLMSGVIMSFFYALEFFIVWYADEPPETYVFVNRLFGEKAWAFWLMLICNVGAIQVLWFKSLRTSEAWLFVVSLFVLVGMWMERYVIVITTLMDGLLPSVQGHYSATKWDWMLYIGSMGLFVLGLLLVLRFLPFIPITEVKEGEEHEAP